MIEIALVEVVNGKLTGNTFQTYINPEGRKSTPNAIRTHKLKISFLLDKPLFKTQLPQILDFIGKSQLVFFNEDFDLEFLDNEAKLAGSKVRFSTDYKTTCVQKQVMSATRRKRHISLDNACRMYGVDTSLRKVHGKELSLTRLKPSCGNVGKSILEHPELYWLDSKNTKKLQNTKGLPKIVYPDSKGKYHNIREAVSQTFKCKSCHTKFSAPINPQKGQHNQQINYALFSLLVNKGIINRISEVLRINHDLIYSRIEFFYHQCIQFEQFQIFKNIKNLESRNLHLSIDRLHFFANWTSREDARRTPLFNTATVENNTRFVFGSTLNFDFTSDYISLYKEFKRIGEYSKEPFKRRYQQYNLPDENLLDDDTPPLKSIFWFNKPTQ